MFLGSWILEQNSIVVSIHQHSREGDVSWWIVNGFQGDFTHLVVDFFLVNEVKGLY